MADLSIPGRDSVEAQRDMFRLAEKECGLTLAAIARRSPIPLSTLKGWNSGTAMPAWAIGALGEAGVPDHLLSLVLEPFGRTVITGEEDGCGLGALAREAAHFAAEKLDALADGTITPSERAALTERARRVASAALKVVND